MKTKLFLSILMLVVSMMGYASESETTIPLEKMRYAFSHPGTPVIVDSSTIQKLSDNYLWITEDTHYKVIMYEEGRPLNEFGQCGPSIRIFNGWMIFWITICSFLVAFGFYFKKSSLVFAGGIFFLSTLGPYADTLSSALHLLVICLVLAAGIGYIARKFKEKKN